jgi:hypothetical protein
MHLHFPPYTLPIDMENLQARLLAPNANAVVKHVVGEEKISHLMTDLDTLLVSKQTLSEMWSLLESLNTAASIQIERGRQPRGEMAEGGTDGAPIPSQPQTQDTVASDNVNVVMPNATAQRDENEEIEDIFDDMP